MTSAEGLTRHRQGPARHEGPAEPDPDGPPAPMPAHVPLLPGTTPAAFTRLNAGAASRAGVSPAKYAGLLGMSPRYLEDDRYRPPASTNIRIWELLTLHVPWHEVSLRMAEESALGALGVWDYLITQAPTPLEGLHDACRYLATVADAGTEVMHVEQTERHVTISHVNAADLSDEVASAIRAYALGLMRQRIGEAARRPVVPVGVVLAARAPRDHRALVDLFGTRAIEFAGPVNSITFDTADLIAPQPHAPGLSDLLRRHAEQSLTDAIPLHDWLDVFRSTLRAAPDPEVPTLRALAQQLSLSTRTLQRRLEEHGTTWSQELQALRREHTLRLLTTTDMTLDSVARRAGYADPRGLRRAVQRWTGRPLASVRGARSGGIGVAGGGAGGVAPVGPGGPS
ncbi:AraC family transcriptional regulator ligand-binding domain-containing protein [Streptomyces sp. NPDC048606]|uniref:helix-turn-helix transcriptional regulator n=1 Tax=Streptomyces sp. NPDC048606 TaxID=3154726 RepID=UPI0034441605